MLIKKKLTSHITETARSASKAFPVKPGQNQPEYFSNRDQAPITYQDKALAEVAAKLHILLAALANKHLANAASHGNIRTGMGKLKLADFQTNTFQTFQGNKNILVSTDISIAQEYLKLGCKHHLLCAKHLVS